MRFFCIVSLTATALLLGGCSTLPPVNDTAGHPTVYIAPDSSGPVKGIGMESQDVISMADRMARDLLAQPAIAGRPVPPRIIVDSAYFRNEGSSRINKNLITDRLRVDLNRAANGRIVFVGREDVDAVEAERALKARGVTEAGTLRPTTGTAGVDYRLTGRIATTDALDPKTGESQRWTQITFELLDLEVGTVAWSNLYEYAKAAQDDIIYR
jgi:hypothetical protein